MRKHSLFTFSFILFTLFLLFSLVVRLNVLAAFDLQVTIWLQQLFSRRYDFFFSVFSFLGSFDVSFVFVLLLASYLYFSRRIFGAILSLFFFFLILAFELYGKIFIRHPSPSTVFARYIHFFALPSDVLPHPNYSFPSGHSSRTFFLSTLLLLILREKKLSRVSSFLVIFFLLVYDVFMILSRIDLGEHWASDVIGGTLLGVALGSMAMWCTYIFPRIYGRQQK